MITKVEKVMVEKTVYVASDGTEFDYEDSCESYEMKLLLNEFTMLDVFLHTTNDLGHALYVKLDTEEHVHKFIALCDYYEVTTCGLNADMPGIYYYSGIGYEDEWVNLDKVLAAFGKYTLNMGELASE